MNEDTKQLTILVGSVAICIIVVILSAQVFSLEKYKCENETVQKAMAMGYEQRQSRVDGYSPKTIWVKVGPSIRKETKE